MHSQLSLSAILMMATSQGFAQTSEHQNPFNPSPIVEYQSVFDRYQPFADEPLGDWKQANQTVHEIGGWRAYMQEAMQAKQPALPAGASHSNDSMHHHSHSMHGGEK